MSRHIEITCCLSQRAIRAGETWPGWIVDEAPLMRKSSLAVVGHIGPALRGDKISAPPALAAPAALGQPTRLEIFRLLMRREPGGLAAGAIADAIGCPHNTLSTHLSILVHPGLGPCT